MCNAIVGSLRMARRAGRWHANRFVAASNSETLTSVTESMVDICKAHRAADDCAWANNVGLELTEVDV